MIKDLLRRVVQFDYRVQNPDKFQALKDDCVHAIDQITEPLSVAAAETLLSNYRVAYSLGQVKDYEATRTVIMAALTGVK